MHDKAERSNDARAHEWNYTLSWKQESILREDAISMIRMSQTVRASFLQLIVAIKTFGRRIAR
jgi:hypothetical protein